jgi:hypothetical protein
MFSVEDTLMPDRFTRRGRTGEFALYRSGINGAIALFYLAIIVGAELITAVASPIWGVITHGLLLICLVLHASLEKGARFQKFYLALALAPLVRILSLAMPLANFPHIYWYAIVAAPLLLATFTVMVRLGLRSKDAGLT